MKKLISVFLSAVMVLSLCPTAFASNSTAEKTSDNDYVFEPTPDLTHEEIVKMLEADPNTVKCSEYDMILEEKAAAREALESNRITVFEELSAQNILAFDPSDEVYALQEKTDQELQDLGLDEDRIQIIRTFKGTEAELQALSATCSVGGNGKYTKNTSENWAKMAFAFSWDKAPIWQKRDAMVARASTGFMYTRVADVECGIDYIRESSSGSSVYTVKYDSSDLLGNGWSDGNIAGFSFPVRETKTSGLQQGTFYALTGMAVIVFRSLDSNQVTLSYAYAHASRDVTASIGISFESRKPSGVLDFGLSKTYYSLLPNDGCSLDPHFYT